MNHPPSSSPSRISLVLLLVITVFTSSIVLASSSRHYAQVDHFHADGGDHELLKERFHGWMAAHGRSYPTAEEKLRRFHIYRENVEFIEATNRDTSKTYTCGENEFTDLTHEEFLARYTTPRGASRHLFLSPSVITTRAGDIAENDSGTTMQEEEDEVEAAALPEHVDWREENAVTPVKNQGVGCNACWVFAAVATIESAHKIKKGELLNLSEQQMVDCTTQHCGGGYPEDVFSYVKRKGIATESEYGPYHPKENTCRLAAPAVWLKDYGAVPKNKESVLAKRVAKQPVAVQYDATDPGFKCYNSGIYYWGKPCHDNGVRDFDLDHTLAIIGYGKNETTGQKYWIAKNSWGKTWGDGGYVYIQKDLPNNPKGVGGLAIHPTYPIVM